MKGVAEWNRQADQGTRGGGVLESALLHMHALPLIHCLPVFLTLSLCLFHSPTFSFHPRPTFLVVVGVTIQHGAQCEKHKAELGQILHAAQIALEDCTPPQLTQSAPQLCFILLFFSRLLCLSISSVSMFPPQRSPHTHSCTHNHTHFISFLYIYSTVQMLRQVWKNGVELKKGFYK